MGNTTFQSPCPRVVRSDEVSQSASQKLFKGWRLSRKEESVVDRHAIIPMIQCVSARLLRRDTG